MKYWDDCTPAKKIERWENVVRVLQNLSPHEKRMHFKMHIWGMKTDCGTVACAAGHCGMDPWFRRRGLKMDFEYYEETDTWYSSWTHGDDVDNFFGVAGANDIFRETRPRPVSQVTKEVKAYIRKLKAKAKEAS